MVMQSAIPAYAAEYSQPLPESTTRRFLEVLSSAGGPPMETMQPADARTVLEGAQLSVPVDLAPAEVTKQIITTDGHTIPLIIVRPTQTVGLLPAFMFFHGGGWMLGDYPTHERFVRDLVAYSGAVAVFVEYDRSPEVRYPTALNQAYAATLWVAKHGSKIGIDSARLAVAGNSAGGNLAAAVALKAKFNGGPQLACQLLFWPVTDARFDTPSYDTYENGHFLTRGMMRWFWDNYTTNEKQREEIYASPLRASIDQLLGLPPAVIQTAELDVLRDEGEAYARKLNEADVEVSSLRVGGMIHDYGLLNPLAKVPAVQAALRQAGAALKHHLQ